MSDEQKLLLIRILNKLDRDIWELHKEEAVQFERDQPDVGDMIDELRSSFGIHGDDVA